MRILIAIFLLALAAPALADNGGVGNYFTSEAPPGLSDPGGGDNGAQASAIEPAAGTGNEESASDEAGVSDSAAPAGPPRGPVDTIGEEPGARQ